MTYEELSELFKKHAGIGRGNHRNRASTWKRSAHPRYLYFPKSPNTTESDPTGAWEKYDCDAQTLSHLIKVGEETDSVLYELRSPRSANNGVAGGTVHSYKAAEVRKEPAPEVARPESLLVIDDAFLREWEPKYDRIETDEPEYRRLISAVGREISATGTITKETFLDIWRWKGAIRAIRHVMLNQYDGVYAEAFRKAYSEEPERKLDVLFGLPGILAPSGSTLIHMMCPQTMPIIDVRTVGVLFKAGLITSRSCDLDRYELFRRAINGIRNQSPGWNLRQIDRALFAYHKMVMDRTEGNSSLSACS